jgi:DNA segregation ATPase FtsK/SpoIIIE-like protein
MVEHRRELALLGTLFSAAFICASLAFWTADDPTWLRPDVTGRGVKNACGPLGANAADLLYRTLGWGAWICALGLVGPVYALARRPFLSARQWLVTGWLLTVLLGLAELIAGPPGAATFRPGGALGALVATSLVDVVGRLGAWLALLAGLISGVSVAFSVSWADVAAKVVDMVQARSPAARAALHEAASWSGRSGLAATRAAGRFVWASLDRLGGAFRAVVVAAAMWSWSGLVGFIGGFSGTVQRMRRSLGDGTSADADGSEDWPGIADLDSLAPSDADMEALAAATPPPVPVDDEATRVAASGQVAEVGWEPTRAENAANLLTRFPDLGRRTSPPRGVASAESSLVSGRPADTRGARRTPAVSPRDAAARAAAQQLVTDRSEDESASLALGDGAASAVPAALPVTGARRPVAAFGSPRAAIRSAADDVALADGLRGDTVVSGHRVEAHGGAVSAPAARGVDVGTPAPTGAAQAGAASPPAADRSAVRPSAPPAAPAAARAAAPSDVRGSAAGSSVLPRAHDPSSVARAVPRVAVVDEEEDDLPPEHPPTPTRDGRVDSTLATRMAARPDPSAAQGHLPSARGLGLARRAPIEAEAFGEEDEVTDPDLARAGARRADAVDEFEDDSEDDSIAFAARPASPRAVAPARPVPEPTPPARAPHAGVEPAWSEPVVEDELHVEQAEGLLMKVQDDGGAVADRSTLYFELPHLSLLDTVPEQIATIDEDELRELARTVTESLASFKVTGRVTNVRVGPVVTTFEFLPDSGISVRRIAILADDLAMALCATSIRVVAPIPGKGVVGIEVPSKHRMTIYLRELLASEEFRGFQGGLPVILGKDVEGRPMVGDLAKMPHLLVGGTTGSGKSVGVNGMLISLLYTRTPEELRLLLVDPKKLEFEAYADVPHLLHPVVTEPKAAAAALAWACREMDRRYELLARWGTRNIANYNRKVERESRSWTREKARMYAPRDWPDDTPPPGPELLPYIVIVIDELADLMMVAKKDVQDSVVRIAQMARACGMHLIVATQRPSVDVVTGLIKSNLPTRVSFKLRSVIDSRTILDQGGAEKLLGQGDMLYLPGAGEVQRCHGPFVSDDEVGRVIGFLKQQREPDYIETITATEGEVDEMVDPEDQDDLYDEAVRLVKKLGKASASMIQRHFKIGYNRAARIIDMMESAGVVGAADGARPREVLGRDDD